MPPTGPQAPPCCPTPGMWLWQGWGGVERRTRHEPGSWNLGNPGVQLSSGPALVRTLVSGLPTLTHCPSQSGIEPRCSGPQLSFPPHSLLRTHVSGIPALTHSLSQKGIEPRHRGYQLSLPPHFLVRTQASRSRNGRWLGTPSGIEPRHLGAQFSPALLPGTEPKHPGTKLSVATPPSSMEPRCPGTQLSLAALSQNGTKPRHLVPGPSST